VFGEILWHLQTSTDVMIVLNMGVTRHTGHVKLTGVWSENLIGKDISAKPSSRWEDSNGFLET